MKDKLLVVFAVPFMVGIILSPFVFVISWATGSPYELGFMFIGWIAGLFILLRVVFFKDYYQKWKSNATASKSSREMDILQALSLGGQPLNRLAGQFFMIGKSSPSQVFHAMAMFLFIVTCVPTIELIFLKLFFGELLWYQIGLIWPLYLSIMAVAVAVHVFVTLYGLNPFQKVRKKCISWLSVDFLSAQVRISTSSSLEISFLPQSFSSIRWFTLIM